MSAISKQHNISSLRNLCIADSSGSFFQIRPHKEFSPAKGRDKLLSLKFLAELRIHEDSDTQNTGIYLDRTTPSLYSTEGDPIAQKWNAAIRLANYASLDATPLCVSYILSSYLNFYLKSDLLDRSST